MKDQKILKSWSFNNLWKTKSNITKKVSSIELTFLLRNPALIFYSIFLEICLDQVFKLGNVNREVCETYYHTFVIKCFKLHNRFKSS